MMAAIGLLILFIIITGAVIMDSIEAERNAREKGWNRRWHDPR